MKPIQIILCLIISLSMFACESEDTGAFHMAKQENMIEAFKEFIKDYPNSRHTTEANKLLFELIDNADNGEFKDPRDGQIYKTIIMRDGNVWMAENMNYNGKELLDGALCYKYKESNCDEYGRLYIWSAVQKACPKGWHLPSDNEWWELFKHYGGARQQSAFSTGEKRPDATKGKKAFWQIVNDTKFNIQFGGWRSRDPHNPFANGGFNDGGEDGYYWTSTKIGNKHYWYEIENGLITQWYNSIRDTPQDYPWAWSCRCVKN